jgi:hypothetical protein
MLVYLGSYKIFSFCEQTHEQTLKTGANDAPGQGLQSVLKNWHQNWHQTIS